jgi:hypothetical protein
MTVSANPCAGVVGRWYVQGGSCDIYYLCENSVATKMRCPRGFLFDFYLQACNYGNLENCDDPCFGVPNSILVGRISAGCGVYYVCQNGIGSRRNCPDGFNFDFERQVCSHPDDFECVPNPPTVPTVPPTTTTVSTTAITTTTTTTTPAPGPCAGYLSGTFIPYPPNGCGGYQRCENGISVSTGTCDNERYFSFETQTCDYKENVNCYFPKL